MPGWLIAFMSTCLTAFAGVLVKDIWSAVKKNGKKHKERLAQEQKDNLRAVIKEENKPLEERLNSLENKVGLIGNGTETSLRNALLAFYRECAKKGYRTEIDTENFTHMYDDYCALGGNSFIQKDVKE